jgi:hypothetical protein
MFREITLLTYKRHYLYSNYHKNVIVIGTNTTMQLNRGANPFYVKGLKKY